MERNLVAHVYNPDNQTKEGLIDSFVVRLGMFQKIYKEIEEADMKHPEQHLLIEGKRGMGKTTLLWRLAYEIENDSKLNSWLLPIVFNEEEYGISKLFKLWERIAELLEDKSDEFYGLFQEMDDRFENYESTEAYEYDAFALLSKRLEEKGKKIILFIDNFGDITSKFKKQEAQRLREVLQNSNNLRIVAASSVVLEAHYNARHPFYELFRIERLKGLNQEETEILLLKLGEVYKQESIKDILENQKGRVEALRRLTSGVIRSIVLMFEIFVDKKSGTAFNDLEAILDKVTPLYKHRMDDLSAQQQEIVQAIAMAWDAVNVKEISKATRIPGKAISAQMKTLVQNEIINKIPTSTKNFLYQINERFFNIWYLMRHGRKGDKTRVLWLVRFLEEWCDVKELEKRAKAHISALKSGSYDVRGAYYMAEALAHSRHISLKTEVELLKETKAYLNKSGSEYSEWVSEADQILMDKVNELVKRGENIEALKLINKLKKRKAFGLGWFYSQIEYNFEKAEQYYLKAIEFGDLKAPYNLAMVYGKQNEINKAEKYYLKAINIGDSRAPYNLANLYNDKNAFGKAEKYYLMAIEYGNIEAINNLAIIFSKQNELKKAEEYYLMAEKQGDENSIYNLAILYANQKRYEEAEKYYLKTIAKGDVEALYNLANVYVAQNEFLKAEEFYLNAISKGHDDAKALLVSMTFLYQKNLSKALDYSRKFIEENSSAKLIEAKAELLVWNKEPKRAIEIMSSFWYDKKFIEENEKILGDFLVSLFANHYFIEVYNYFTASISKQLKLIDRLKPYYYVALFFLKDKYQDERLRMGDELKETVYEIIKKVEELREWGKDLK